MLFKPAAYICFFFTFFFIGILYARTNTDAIVATLLPVSLIRGNGFDLKKISPISTIILPSKVDDNKLPYYIIEKNNHQFSTFPVFSSILAVPIYFFPTIIKNITLENLENHKSLIFSLGKISASIFSAISISFVFLSSSALTRYKKALILTVLYALGTSTLSISSQTLWQHATSQMFLAITMYFFIKGQKQKNKLPFCGLFLGLATLSRFTNLIIALTFFVYMILFEKRSLIGFLKYSILPLLFFIWYQLTYPGGLFFYKYEAIGEIAKFNNSFLEGFFGLLIAPNKGLLIYSPFFLFSIWGTCIAWKEKNKPLIFFSVLSLIYITFIAKWNVWHGSWSYGPRMLADITPILTILIAPVVNNTKIYKHIMFKLVFFSAALVSVFVHFLGASVADFSWYSIQTTNLTQDQVYKASIPWNWNFPEIYFFYRKVGGFSGVTYVFTLELINIALTIIKGFTFLFIFYIVFNLKKKKLTSLIKYSKPLQ
ncbi:hypothetical protein A3A49_02895 [Candidatus Curtissbacteria bacterium RIFCSPLOWO2_01_FULL_38_11b]|uniref:Glycosyltransferase RgtA/B/C/D-like domain-containing protein n=1 Tax=Candidatus Curtissbacteria bacterium RIFCSPLOWO2_01_FULL_38_11b TaxID=1797725 RepID=A0A1F5H080_9BACT|nr:MAG: hypothetical protein A3A49_02895 [Candidatus Curtissbacteria bacterium RIFCSPLOWO2_01_FULL_38_11b]